MMTSGFDKQTDSIEANIQKRLTGLANKYPGDIVAALPSADVLIANFRHDDMKVRREAAFALGDSGIPAAVIPLAEAFYAYERKGIYLYYNQPNDVRLALAMALFTLGESEELSVVFSSESSYIRPGMVKAMFAIDSKRIIKVLLDALSVDRYALSYWATRALGELRDRRAVEPLLKVLQQHNSADERVAAADSLGFLGDKRAIPVLELVRQKDQEKNWFNRSVSQAATISIDEILRSKGKAPLYSADNLRHIGWVGGRFEYEADQFLAKIEIQQGISLDYDSSSVAWMDGYIEEVRADLSPEDREDLVKDFSTLYGECLRHCSEGKWMPSEGCWAIIFGEDDVIFPFDDVRQALDGPKSSLAARFLAFQSRNTAKPK